MANWKPKKVDLSIDLSTVLSTPAIVRGFYVNTTLSAHACNINNGSDTVFIIPASLVAGTVVDFAGEQGVLFDVNLIIDPDNAATGSITIMYTERVQ